LASVQAFTVFGPDWRGDLFRQVLERAGVSLDHVLVQPDRFTPFYGKVILSGHGNRQEDARLDFINTVSLNPQTETDLISRLEADLRAGRLDAVVVADYQANGVITPTVRSNLNRLAGDYPDVAFLVDSREQVGEFHRMIIKPNEVEATRLFYPGYASGSSVAATGGASADLPDLAVAGIRWQAQEGRPVCITLGERGCLVCQQSTSGGGLIPAIPVPPPLDTVGAGDTFLSALAAGVAAGARIEEAAQLAILAASVSIRKLHITGTASPAEIMATFDIYFR
jgi:sugar/nucleoside kinase (ribokinase family)